MERFLNICAHRQILLSDVKYKGSACLTAKVSGRGFKQLRGPAHKTKTRVSIISKKGAPFYCARLMRRKALAAGFVLFSLLIFFLTTRVWVIDVEGNVDVPAMDIIKQLEACGLKPGVHIWSVNPDKLQVSVLARMPELSWIWVTVEGTRAVAQVKERVPKPDIVPQDIPCNIVAKSSGVITRLIVKNGKAMVKEGMAVAEGQLLVSGLLESQVVGIRYVRSDAEVWAKTNHTLSGTYSLTQLQRTETGKKTVRRSVVLMGKELNLYLGQQCPYGKYNSTVEQATLKVLKSLYLPAVIRTFEYREVKETERKLSADQVISEAKASLEKSLRLQIAGGSIDDMKFEIANIDDNTVSVSLTAQCTEQIAQKAVLQK